MSTTWETPHEVTDLDRAFPARGPELTPAYEDVPEEFKTSMSLWVQFIKHWFYHGDPFSAFVVYGPKEGIDGDLAIRHLEVVLGTFGTKHEHKMAGAAWLMSLWFERIENKK